MADYNIYIHTDGKTGTSQQTSAWNPSQTTTTTSWTDGISQTSEIATNPDGIIAAGVGMMAKALPWVAAAIVVARTLDKVMTAVDSYLTTQDGDYSFQVGYSNFKASVNMLFRPVGNTINSIRFENQIRVDNARKRLQTELFADAVLNNMNRGV